ncbi:MAG: enoyl-CoA hydratase/isomerase family protein [Gemmatimonadaceae bacterium]|nr:enoyl-CoA hydratase/isomerase family protein [Gemmatimonadaceae bacterium]
MVMGEGRRREWAGNAGSARSVGATLDVMVDGPVTTITLRRPEVLNCLCMQSIDELSAVVERLRRDPDVRVVVVRGAGRAFCTGIDLNALARGEIEPRFYRDWEEALRGLETLDAFSIAAIHSHCIGGGFQLALACDLRVARADASFGVTAVKEGIMPGLGMWRIARHAGIGRAKRLALTAETIGAEVAQQWGLVEDVVPADGFEAAVADRVRRLLEMGWTSTRLSKKLINMTFESSYAEMLEVFSEFQRRSTDSAEHRQAMAERRARLETS